MKKVEGRFLAEIGGRDFVGASNTGFFRPKCAKTRLKASITSKISPGFHTWIPVNHGRQSWGLGVVTPQILKWIRVRVRIRERKEWE
jgi:hypothetical protein